jgi:hypothetical protein
MRVYTNANGRFAAVMVIYGDFCQRTSSRYLGWYVSMAYNECSVTCLMQNDEYTYIALCLPLSLLASLKPLLAGILMERF